MSTTGTAIKFRSEVSVELIDSMGSDLRIAEAARVSSGAETGDMGEPEVRLIEFLASANHTSPFEQGAATLLFEVPIFVAREHMRHRTQSYNEESGRWRVLDSVFYVPGPDRPTKQFGRTGEYRLEPDAAGNAAAKFVIEQNSMNCYAEYEYLLGEGVAKEVARMVLPVNIFTRYYATANLLNWIKFLKLRTDPTAMLEIRSAATQVQHLLTAIWPVAMQAYGF